MAKITFQDKVALNPQPSVANINKVSEADMNEIKSSVNDNCSYSTNEICIGEWIDGKPLYRKVISSTTPSQVNTGTNIYNATSMNIDKIINLSFTFKGTYNEYATASNIIIMFTRISGTDRQIACTCTLQDYCNKPFYFILEYTKTTD